jgi:enoyl-CoA hydratase/carnithine racemase
MQDGSDSRDGKAMSTQDLVVSKDDGVWTLTLNRPAQRNAFSRPMLDAWESTLREARDDETARVLVLTGAGSAFCAGGNLSEIQEEWRNGDAIEQKNQLWRGVLRVPMALAELDKPVIAAINGAASGAGLDMALMCDIRLASDRAKLAESYINVGLVPGDGGAFFLPRLVGLGRACELLFTGDPITAQEAERIGLVNRVVPHDELLTEAQALARRIAAKPTQAMRMTKRLIYAGLESSLKTALDMSSSFFSHVLALDETDAAITAALERISKPRDQQEKSNGK